MQERRVDFRIKLPKPPRQPKNTMQKICIGAIACAVILLLLIVAQAITGSLLAVAARQPYEQSEALRAAAVARFGTLSAMHGLVGYFMILPALFLTAFAVLFTVNAPDYTMKHTRRPWLVTALGVALALIFVWLTYQGNHYAGRLRLAGFWLTPRAASVGAPSPPGIDDATAASTFFTFIGLHGIVLPFLAVLTIIFIWPSFYEFVAGSIPRAGGGGKWKDLG